MKHLVNILSVSNWTFITKLILPGCLVLIILLGTISCATNAPGAAGVINGRPISVEEFYSAYRGHYAMFSYNNGRVPDKDEKNRIFNETWQNITKSIILKDYYAKYKITTDPKEVLDTLSSSIPQHILQSTRFQVNGKFDNTIYMQSLLTDRPENLSALRRHYQVNIIPILKLQHKLIEKELITSKISQHIQKVMVSEADMNLYIFDSARMTPIVSDNDVNTFYQANLATYRLQPYYRIAFGLVPVIPDSLDHQYAKAVADSVCSFLNSGISYEEIKAARAKQTSLLSMIDYGFVKSSELPEDIKNLLLPLTDGTCTIPQQSGNGWIIYQKLQSTKTLTQYRSVFVQSLPRTESLIHPETTARRLMNLALNIGLEEACDEFDFKFSQSERMHPDSLKLPASDIKGQLLKRLKVAKAASIIEPLYSAELSAFVVVEVLENQDKEFIALNEVKAAITEELSVQKRRDMALQLVKQWQSEPNSTDQYQVVKLSAVNMDSSLESYPLDVLFYKGVSAFMEKQEAPIVTQNNLFIVPTVLALRATNRKVSPLQIRKAFTNSLPENWFEQWLSDQVAKAKVVRNINS